MKLSTALALARGSNLPTVWTNILAGVVLAGGTANPGRLGILAAMGTLLYAGGMFLNDACDAAIDAEERPERPIPAGLATRREVVVGAGLLLTGGIVLAGSLGFAPLIAALVTVGLIIAYNLHHKENALAPVIMGGCRMGLYACAALSVSPDPPLRVWIGAAALLTYVLGLTYAAAREHDGAGSLRGALMLGLWAPLVAGAWMLGTLPGPAHLALVVGFGLWTAQALRSVKTRRPRRIRHGVISLIAGISLVDALLIAAVSGPPLALVALAAFLLTLALQRVVAGT